ncbi:MAG: NAD(P)-binding protein, partial [Rickettsiales bacterium]|nr:NAD(P)-binding protein [Rickettsiales bacterium]
LLKEYIRDIHEIIGQKPEEFQREIAKLKKAVMKQLENSPFAEWTGLLCNAPCETGRVSSEGGLLAGCTIGSEKTDPVHIRSTEHYLAELAWAFGWIDEKFPRPMPVREQKEEDPLDAKILIVGAGPAGLSAAYELSMLGYRNITVADRNPQIGGAIFEYIPDHKIPATSMTRFHYLLGRANVGIGERANITFDLGREVDAAYAAEFDTKIYAVGTLHGVEERNPTTVPGYDAIKHLIVPAVHALKRVKMSHWRGEDIEPAQGNRIIIGGGFTSQDATRRDIRRRIYNIEHLPEERVQSVADELETGLGKIEGIFVVDKYPEKPLKPIGGGFGNLLAAKTVTGYEEETEVAGVVTLHGAVIEQFSVDVKDAKKARTTLSFQKPKPHYQNVARNLIPRDGYEPDPECGAVRDDKGMVTGLRLRDGEGKLYDLHRIKGTDRFSNTRQHELMKGTVDGTVTIGNVGKIKVAYGALKGAVKSELLMEDGIADGSDVLINRRNGVSEKEGVFVSGDANPAVDQTIVSAMASGKEVASVVHRYLQEHGRNPEGAHDAVREYKPVAPGLKISQVGMKVTL